MDLVQERDSTQGMCCAVGRRNATTSCGIQQRRHLCPQSGEFSLSLGGTSAEGAQVVDVLLRSAKRLTRGAQRLLIQLRILLKRRNLGATSAQLATQSVSLSG